MSRPPSNLAHLRGAAHGISLACGSPRQPEEVAHTDRGGEEDALIRRIVSTSGSRPRSPTPGRVTAAISRRAFLGSLAGAGLAAPFAAEAQQPERLYRIGMVERTSIEINAANVQGFRQGLRQLGYVEGESFAIEYRSADGQDGRFPGLAGELVRMKVDLILTRGTPAALAVKNATATIPVVIIGVGDPVGQGLVASLAHPGGNVTGLSAAVTEIYPKRVQLLRELVPRAARISGLFNMSNPALPAQWREIERAARSLDIEPHLLDVRRPEELEPAFNAATRLRSDALIVGLDTLTQANQLVIVDLAARHRLPAIYASTEFARGLVTYGVNYPEMYRRAARFAHKIFKGARPADLPVEEPTAFELVINMRTARALGLTVPPSLLVRADHLIE
jgi:putative ABC transport system substrate-binding protein